jgi:hypothetical protein
MHLSLSIAILIGAAVNYPFGLTAELAVAFAFAPPVTIPNSYSVSVSQLNARGAALERHGGDRQLRPTVAHRQHFNRYSLVSC